MSNNSKPQNVVTLGFGNLWLDRLFAVGIGAAISGFIYFVLFVVADSGYLPASLFVPIGKGYLPRFGTSLIGAITIISVLLSAIACWLLRRGVVLSVRWLWASASANIVLLTFLMVVFGRLPIPFWGQ